MSGNVKLLLRAFITPMLSLIRPMLEYNSVTWSPHLKYDIGRIEKVQRQFTKRLYDFKYLCYEERLTKLGIPSLELRRLYLDLTYCYKIVIWTRHFEHDRFFSSFHSLQAREDIQTV